MKKIAEIKGRNNTLKIYTYVYNGENYSKERRYLFSIYDWNPMCGCEFELDKKGIKVLIKKLQEMIKEEE